MKIHSNSNGYDARYLSEDCAPPTAITGDCGLLSIADQASKVRAKRTARAFVLGPAGLQWMVIRTNDKAPAWVFGPIDVRGAI